MGITEQLEQVYDAHSNALYAYLLQLLRNEDLVKDVLQEVFRKLARTSQFQQDGPPTRQFLIRMAHNQAIDLLRRENTIRQYRNRYRTDPATLFTPVTDPDAAAFQAAVANALSELPTDQRTVVHLKLWEHQTFEQIGNILEISPHTAASRYRYGIEKLRSLLRPLYQEIL